MRKTIIAALMAAAMLPAAAQAQNHELRRDRQEIRHERRDVIRAERRGAPPHVVRDERRDLRSARREYREDWHGYRRDHRDVYRRTAYVGPRGYAYRPIAVGHRFDRPYYASNYWVSDYGRYRLRTPGYGRRWVRYGNDVALVNVRTGRVVAVNNGFFW